MDCLEQDVQGLLVLCHIFWFNFNFKRVFVVHKHKFLVVKAECLIVAVFYHHVEDLNGVSVFGEKSEEFDEFGGLLQDSLLKLDIISGELVEYAFEMVFGLLI